MKIASVLLTLVVFGLGQLTAQTKFKELNITVRTGVTMSDFGGDYKKMKTRTGFMLGAHVDYNINTFLFVRSGIEISQKGAKEKRIVD